MKKIYLYITNNFLLKLSALILATILWFYVAGEDTIDKVTIANIKVLTSKQMVVVHQNVDVARIELRCRREDAKQIEKQKIFVELDISDYQNAQKLIVPIETKNIKNLPGEINIQHIFPGKVSLEIDMINERVLPVSVITKGEPASGHNVQGHKVDPVSVSVRGPEKILNEMDAIKTEPVDITGRVKSFKKMVPLEQLPIKQNIEPPQFVEVFIQLSGEYQFSPRKTLEEK